MLQACACCEFPSMQLVFNLEGQPKHTNVEERSRARIIKCRGLPSMRLVFKVNGEPAPDHPRVVVATQAAAAAAACAKDALVALATQETELKRVAEELLAQSAKVRKLREDAEQAVAQAAEAEGEARMFRETRNSSNAGGSSSNTAAPSLPPLIAHRLAPLADLDPALYEPMANWTYSTWRIALSRPIAHEAEISPDLRERLLSVWSHALTMLETTGANWLQLTSFFEGQFPYEFNLLAHAAVGVERHRLKEALVAEQLPAGAAFLTMLGDRLTARILFAMTGTSSKREREQLNTATAQAAARTASTMLAAPSTRTCATPQAMSPLARSRFACRAM
eukprot:934225-Prymnesium_polylepis.1